MLLTRPRLRAASPGPGFLVGIIFLAGLLIGGAFGLIGDRSREQDHDPARYQPLPPLSEPIRGSVPVDVLRVVDGDTFEARVHLWPGLDVTTRIRLRSIDAPEMKARCGEEYAKAQAARDALAAMLRQGDVTISQVGHDKYAGRVVAEAATRGTPDVSQAMIRSGLARPYEGGRRDGWCRG